MKQFTHDLGPLIEQVEAIVDRHHLGRPGAYARWTLPGAGESQAAGALNPYGCADAANILYTIGRFPRDTEQRRAWISTLQDLQDERTGLFHEATHHDYHCTAHCVAAIELFDARPRHPLAALHPLKAREQLEAFLDQLDWQDQPWASSHQGAGIYAALTIAGEAGPEWEDWYFGWLEREADPATGFWRKDNVQRPDSAPLFHHLAGSFHYLFNHEAARRPLPYPQRMIDTCLQIEADDLVPTLGRSISFSEVDWVYCITRSLRQSGHRFGECQAALQRMADRMVASLAERQVMDDPDCDDLHRLFGMLCALAELQQALPGSIRTPRPLRLVLDRRPFI